MFIKSSCIAVAITMRADSSTHSVRWYETGRTDDDSQQHAKEHEK
jgi:hypothetical protein